MLDNKLNHVWEDDDERGSCLECHCSRLDSGHHERTDECPALLRDKIQELEHDLSKVKVKKEEMSSLDLFLAEMEMNAVLSGAYKSRLRAMVFSAVSEAYERGKAGK